MAVSEELVRFNSLGWYYRYSLADGDVLYVLMASENNQHRIPPQGGYNIFAFSGVPWIATPGTGCTISVEVSFRPDFDKSNTAHWFSHGVHDSITTQTGYTETSLLEALRYTASGGSAEVEVRSTFPLRLE